MRTIAHVTHEAVHKVGGIGAVLEGLLTSTPYQAAEQRTILIGPLFVTEDGVKGRLGSDGEVLYSSIDHLPPHPVGEALDRVRREFHVQMVYGHRDCLQVTFHFIPARAAATKLRCPVPATMSSPPMRGSTWRSAIAATPVRPII